MVASLVNRKAPDDSIMACIYNSLDRDRAVVASLVNREAPDDSIMACVCNSLDSNRAMEASPFIR